jgi:hypothetical protein
VEGVEELQDDDGEGQERERGTEAKTKKKRSELVDDRDEVKQRPEDASKTAAD